MGANRLEHYTIEKVNRRDIHGADYNPRKITEEAAKKLRKELREIGLLSPIVVNRTTMNIVSGHQRIDAMDSLLRKDDYELTVAMVELTEEEEVKANILMNNPAVQGEWDPDKMVDIKGMFPEIDFQADLGFDQLDIDYLFAGSEQFAEVAEIFVPPAAQETKSTLEKMKETDNLKAAKRDYREKAKAANAEGTSYQVDENDYHVTFVFNNNTEKRDFMRRIHQKETEKFIKATILYDIQDGKYPLRGRVE
jgi:hypothetical protein